MWKYLGHLGTDTFPTPAGSVILSAAVFLPSESRVLSKAAQQVSPELLLSDQKTTTT
jgi:hypothetical protein